MMKIETFVQAVSLDDLLKEVWKTFESEDHEKVFVQANKEHLETQKKDLKTIEKLIAQTKEAASREDVYTNAAIIVGYANAMEAHGIISSGELQRLNALIGTVAERRIAELESRRHGAAFRNIMRMGKVTA